MVDASVAAWLRLTLTRGIGLDTQRRLLSVFGLPERIFAAPGSAVASAVGDKAARLLAAFDDDEAVVRALEWAGQPGNHLVTLADAAYPKALLETSDPPTLLYVKARSENGRRIFSATEIALCAVVVAAGAIGAVGLWTGRISI